MAAKEPTYEQARDELAGVVASLEAGGLTLEQSLARWGRGGGRPPHSPGGLEDARGRLDAAEPPE